MKNNVATERICIKIIVTASCSSENPGAIIFAINGEKITTAIGYAKDKEIKLNKCIEFPHSVGLMYTALTTFLGFKANNDEYKVMGLAPYGKINRITNKHYKKMTKLIVINYGSNSLRFQSSPPSNYFSHFWSGF